MRRLTAKACSIMLLILLAGACFGMLVAKAGVPGGVILVLSPSMVSLSVGACGVMAGVIRPTWRRGREMRLVGTFAAAGTAASAAAWSVSTGGFWFTWLLVAVVCVATWALRSEVVTSEGNVASVSGARRDLALWGLAAGTAGVGIAQASELPVLDAASIPAALLLGVTTPFIAGLVVLLLPWAGGDRARMAARNQIVHRWLAPGAVCAVCVTAWFGARLVDFAGGTAAVVACLAAAVTAVLASCARDDESPFLGYARAIGAVVLIAAVASTGLRPSIDASSVEPAGVLSAAGPAVDDAGAPSSVSQWGAAFDRCATVVEYLKQKDCYSRFFIAEADRTTVDDALDELVAIHRSPEGVTFRNHCHEVLHDLAKDQSEKFSAEEMLASWRVTCTGGFAHGVLVAYAEQVGWKSIEAKFPTFCSEITTKVVDRMKERGKPVPSDTGWIEWNCNHMLGHVAYEQHRDTIPAGAALCTSWPAGDTRWKNCGAGFFMEYFLDVTRELHGKSRPKTADEIHQVCREVTPAVQEMCYNESGAAVSAFAGPESTPAFKVCREVTPEEFVVSCYAGVSRMVTVTNGFRTADMKAACVAAGEVDARAQDQCGEEVAGALVMETDAPEAASRVCDEVVVNVEQRARCHERVDSVSAQLDGSNLGGGTGEVQG